MYRRFVHDVYCPTYIHVQSVTVDCLIFLTYSVRQFDEKQNTFLHTTLTCIPFVANASSCKCQQAFVCSLLHITNHIHIVLRKAELMRAIKPGHFKLIKLCWNFLIYEIGIPINQECLSMNNDLRGTLQTLTLPLNFRLNFSLFQMDWSAENAVELRSWICEMWSIIKLRALLLKYGTFLSSKVFESRRVENV